jgi:hypothetical protein
LSALLSIGPNFMISTAAQFPRQMQFGIRVRF